MNTPESLTPSSVNIEAFLNDRSASIPPTELERGEIYILRRIKSDPLKYDFAEDVLVKTGSMREETLRPRFRPWVKPYVVIDLLPVEARHSPASEYRVHPQRGTVHQPSNRGEWTPMVGYMLTTTGMLDAQCERFLDSIDEDNKH